MREAISGADAVFILMEWEEFKNTPLQVFVEHMKQVIIYGGNCYSVENNITQLVEKVQPKIEHDFSL